MKVKISFTIDVDPEAWANEYGVDRSDVRDDVRVYIANGAYDQLRDMGLLIKEEGR